MLAVFFWNRRKIYILWLRTILMKNAISDSIETMKTKKSGYEILFVITFYCE